MGRLREEITSCCGGRAQGASEGRPGPFWIPSRRWDILTYARSDRLDGDTHAFVRSQRSLEDRSRNRCGVFLTVLFPFLVAAWGMTLTLYESLKPMITNYDGIDLATLDPLYVKVSCLLVDARGAINPICAGWNVSTLEPDRLAPVMGFSIRQPFSAHEGACFSGVTGFEAALAAGPSSNLTSLAGAQTYSVDLSSTWERAGTALGARRESLYNASTRCDARNPNGTLAGDGVGMAVFRDLGTFPLCPFRTATVQGAWQADIDIGGVGFVMQTPALSTDDTLAGFAWDEGACVREGVKLELLASESWRHRVNGLDRAVPVGFAGDAAHPMSYALNRFSSYVLTADLGDRMSVVQYSLGIERVKRMALLNGDLGALDTVSVVARPRSGELRPARINPIFYVRVLLLVAHRSYRQWKCRRWTRQGQYKRARMRHEPRLTAPSSSPPTPLHRSPSRVFAGGAGGVHIAACVWRRLRVHGLGRL